MIESIKWQLWGKRQYRKWLDLMQTSDIPITVEHTTQAEYSEGPFGPTTLGEFLGMKDIFVARMIFDHRSGYTWDLDNRGRLLHGKIWNLKGNRTDTTDPIHIMQEDRAWFEQASNEAFVLAKLRM